MNLDIVSRLQLPIHHMHQFKYNQDSKQLELIGTVKVGGPACVPMRIHLPVNDVLQQLLHHGQVAVLDRDFSLGTVFTHAGDTPDGIAIAPISIAIPYDPKVKSDKLIIRTPPGFQFSKS
jgi:hypothetical protein